MVFANQRLTLKTSPTGGNVYGNLKDGADAAAEVNNVCTWLMDPVACPTECAALPTESIADGTREPSSRPMFSVPCAGGRCFCGSGPTTLYGRNTPPTVA